MLQNAVFSILFVIGFLAGAAASAANAADVQDGIDLSASTCDNPINDIVSEMCDNWEQLRNSMAAAAVSFSTLVITLSNFIMVLFVTRHEKTSLMCT